MQDVNLNRRFLEADDENAEEAFNRVFHAYYPIVFNSINKDLRNHSDVDAGGIANDTFLQAFSERKGIREPKKLLGWLIRVAKNLTINEIKRSHSQMERLPIESVGSLADLEDEAAFGSILAEADAEYAEAERYQVDQLRHLLQGKDREVFEFRREGLTLKEIAAVKGLKPKTVEKRWERLCEWLGPIAGTLDALVECLPKTDRNVMERRLDGQSLSEIAKAIGISSSAVAERVKRVIAAWKKAARANPEDPVSAMGSEEG